MSRVLSGPSGLAHFLYGWGEMTSGELGQQARNMVGGILPADLVEQMIARLDGIGADQYEYVAPDGSIRQKFEDLSHDELAIMFEEEIIDAANYAVMIAAKDPALTIPSHFANEVLPNLGKFWNFTLEFRKMLAE